jgi:hypothetical protein
MGATDGIGIRHICGMHTGLMSIALVQSACTRPFTHSHSHAAKATDELLMIRITTTLIVVLTRIEVHHSIVVR